MRSIALCFCIVTALGFTSRLTTTAGRSMPRFKVSSTPPPLRIHHTAIKTRNITTAIQFYSLFGFRVGCQFRAGPARAAWLSIDDDSDQHSDESSSQSGAQLELLEVPSYVLNEPPGTRSRALNLMERQEVLGPNHFALDVTAQIRHAATVNATNTSVPFDLRGWLDHLNATSFEKFGRTLRPCALEPRQVMIGRGVYELAFLYDVDGALVEVLHKQTELKQSVDSGWNPWDGDNFKGVDTS